MNVTRKTFLLTGLSALAGAVPIVSLGQSATPAPSLPDRGPQIDPDLIRDFVIAGHGNLENARTMLEEAPALVNAVWDWGGGDFETALGGAAHMGRRDIAEFLLSNNARLDLFAAAMLGKTEIVKAAVSAFPKIVAVPGPHGIPLIAHAEKGGADEVVAFLKTLSS